MEPSILYASPEPYPAVQVSAPNLTYAQMLSMPFASAKSELTTITQYTYFNWVLEPDWADLAAVYQKVAQVEMRHLHLLGQLITALGGQPHLPVISLQKTGLLEQRRPAIPGK